MIHKSPKKIRNFNKLKRLRTLDFGYTRLRNVLNQKYGKNRWLLQSLSYLMARFHPIEKRIIDTFRYVECQEANSNTFSYEFGSILRDTGSTLGSVLDNMVRSTHNKNQNKRLDMSDYRVWLRNEIENLHLVTVGISIPRQDRYIMPFEKLETSEGKLDSWTAYNNLKHSDIEKFVEGNFRNCIYSLGALAVVYSLIDPGNGNRIKLFDEIGYVEPEATRQALLFFK